MEITALISMIQHALDVGGGYGNFIYHHASYVMHVLDKGGVTD